KMRSSVTPRARRPWTTWRPRNPAPPVTMTLWVDQSVVGMEGAPWCGGPDDTGKTPGSVRGRAAGDRLARPERRSGREPGAGGRPGRGDGSGTRNGRSGGGALGPAAGAALGGAAVGPARAGG